MSFRRIQLLFYETLFPRTLIKTNLQPHRRTLAQIAAEIPQARKLFFAGTKERPTEAPYVALQKKFCAEELKWKAGNSSKIKVKKNA